MSSLVTSTFTIATVLSHIVLAFCIVATLYKQSWGKKVYVVLSRYAIFGGLVVSFVAILGSLLYSQVVGYEPCVLCWWQRVFLYPTFILFVVALYKRDTNVYRYVLPLVALAGVVALYHSYTQLGGVSLLPCTAEGAACSKVFVKEFGYVTIPSMSLTIVLYLLFLGWIDRLSKKSL